MSRLLTTRLLAGLALARLGLATPLEHGLGAVDVGVGDAPIGVVDVDRHGVVVGGDDDALHPPLVGVDVGQADGDELADLALEVLRNTQRPLDTGARDLERVARRDRVVLVELLGHQPAGESKCVERDPVG